MRVFAVSNLHADINGTSILNGVSLSMGKGEIHVLMGPNGSGKSTFAAAIMGSPLVNVTFGNVFMCDEDITAALPEDRAKKGLYLAFQHPVEIVGVGMMPFMRNILASRQMPMGAHDDFKKNIENHIGRMGLAADILERNVNEGFSGGEKKRSELLQLSVFRPHVAIVDEIDSGLDVDGIQLATRELLGFVAVGGSLLAITHAGAMARALNPQCVYIMKEGRIAATGGRDLIDFVEANGFEPL